MTSMDTQKSKVIYTNHLGETFVLNELVYYYDYVTTDPMLDTWKIATKGGCGHIPTEQQSEIAKNPSSALLCLHNYYERYGYPEE
jgi:hypothetical protein